MDGLILLLIAATCSVVLLSIASSYGSLPKQIYEETYAQKLAQNTLLSLYHVTDHDTSSAFYKKSIMVAVSSALSKNDIKLQGRPRDLISGILTTYSTELGWNFMFAILPDGVTIAPESVISTTPSVHDVASFEQNVGAPYCASAALTYPNPGTCHIGGTAGNMCYSLFEVCVWQT